MVKCGGLDLGCDKLEENDVLQHGPWQPNDVIFGEASAIPFKRLMIKGATPREQSLRRKNMTTSLECIEPNARDISKT